MSLKPKRTGIVLAGGSSRRMGKDKSQILFQGERLYQRSLRKLLPFCDDVVLSGHPSHFPLAKNPIIEDIIPAAGPIGGIYSIMKLYPANSYLVLAVDIPLVEDALLTLLCRADDGEHIIVPKDLKGMYEPLVAIYPGKILQKMEEQINAGQRALHHLFSPEVTHFISYEEEGISKGSFHNLNKINDLELLHSLFNEEGESANGA